MWVEARKHFPFRISNTYSLANCRRTKTLTIVSNAFSSQRSQKSHLIGQISSRSVSFSPSKRSEPPSPMSPSSKRDRKDKTVLPAAEPKVSVLSPLKVGSLSCLCNLEISHRQASTVSKRSALGPVPAESMPNLRPQPALSGRSVGSATSRGQRTEPIAQEKQPSFFEMAQNMIAVDSSESLKPKVGRVLYCISSSILF